MKTTKTIFLMLLMVAMPQLTTAKITHLLPRPVSVSVNEGQEPIVVGDAIRLVNATEKEKKAAEILLGVAFTENDNATPIVFRNTDQQAAVGDYELEGYPYEGYTLIVDDGKIYIDASTTIGHVRGLQTLAQLMEGWDDGISRVEACKIDDYPAFKLRGYMHDVGRSFIPFEELKKQIILFARFKVNTFHFHLTENQAWRFEVKAFPQLTSEENMTRLAGYYYTQKQCQELDELASTLGITIIPEIDMPGHSGAFERAMGHKMQTAQGISELKTILSEVAEVFVNAPYIHIGADETTITYPNFLETMTSHIHSLGKKVVVWNPASGVTITKAKGVDMTQMWSTAGKAIAGMPNIDCRYNYINHFDLFADLVGIYKSNIYYANEGSSDIAGTITAVWNDRNLPSWEDIMRQNNVYASVLASTERAWVGGGKQYIEQGGTTLPTTGDEMEEFADWERRFLFHKENSLQDEPIAYVRQSDIRWTITDAFPNGGNKDAVFPPETEGTKSTYTYNNKEYTTHEAAGGGIYLRHTWGTIVPAFYSQPEINHTAYAWAYIYSPENQDCGALIEFQNYGRSEKDLAPENGKWDRKGTRLWVNDEEISAPDWLNAGLTIDNESLLQNENCTARKPTPITLKQGWNKVFIKLPYVAAQGVRLNKWMFTFVLTDADGHKALDNIEYSASEPTAIKDKRGDNEVKNATFYAIDGRKTDFRQGKSAPGIYIRDNANERKKIILK